MTRAAGISSGMIVILVYGVGSDCQRFREGCCSVLSSLGIDATYDLRDIARQRTPAKLDPLASGEDLVRVLRTDREQCYPSRRRASHASPSCLTRVMLCGQDRTTLAAIISSRSIG